MNEPNTPLKNSNLTAGQKISKLANEHPVITALTVVTVILGLAALLTKAKNNSDSGRYTEFDTNY